MYSARPVPELILINGEEDFLKERAARDEAEAVLADVSDYFLPEDLDRYLEESSMPPLFGGRRAFVVWGAKEVPALPVGQSDLLVVVSSPKAKLSSPEAKRTHSFPKLRDFDDRNEYLGWIIKEGERLGLDLSRVAGALFVSSRRSLRKISSEIRKLSFLVPAGPVGPADARSVLCYSAELSPKDVVDAICEGHPAKALALLDKLQEGEDETGWVIAHLQRHVVRQALMERLSSAGVPRADAARFLDVHPYAYGKMLDSRLGLWSVQSLSSSLETLCDLDLRHKGGDGSARLCLELEIVRLSKEARDVKRSRS